MNTVCNYLYPYYGKARGYFHYYFPEYTEFDLTEIIPNLYVGNIGAGFNKEKLTEYGITHIIVAIKGIDVPYPADFKYLKIDAIDYEDEDLYKVFNETTEFIDTALTRNGRVLIHCICGVSRSVSIACAYLLYSGKVKSVVEAIEFIKNKRDVASPNVGFQRQLEKYFVEKNVESLIYS